MTIAPWTADSGRSLTELFAADLDRVSRLTVDEGGIHFDFSKTHLDAALIDAFIAALDARGFADARARLFAGDIVNLSERRAATHLAERGSGAAPDVDRAAAGHRRMRALVDAIEAEALGPVRHILHIGIGGSALGPALLVDALGRRNPAYDVAVVSNVDGIALADAFARFDPAATLVVVASKTFTTTETMLNAASALAWLAEHGVDDPYGRVIAITAAPERAVEFGVDETRVLTFAESVGGRYSLWSPVGFPAALALGWDAFEALLEGAAAMDRHFRYAEPGRNAPLVAAFADQLYARGRGAETRALFAYDERLRLLPAYLQQLEMESNGKGVMADGGLLDGPSAPILWGGLGTDAQHAVFQLLHQGTHSVPVEFVAAIESDDGLDPAHHRQLVANCLAQGAALMAGRVHDDPARTFAGDRPSTTLLLDRLDAATLGALIAFYEHRTFANAVLMGINPFDQWGVELGKDIARTVMAAIEGEGEGAFDPSTQALIDRAFNRHPS